MDAFIDGIELIAAFFVGIVAADVFISVMLRYFFSIQIPDAYDFGRLLLGILIFWGIAATSYRGTHITVDLVYANVGDRAKRFIDVLATLVLLFVVTVQTYTLFDKVLDTRRDHVLTFDLRLPTWPFFLVAWLGDVSAVLLDRRADVSADLPSRAFWQPIPDQAGGMSSTARAPLNCHRPRRRTTRIHRARNLQPPGGSPMACVYRMPAFAGMTV